MKFKKLPKHKDWSNYISRATTAVIILFSTGPPFVITGPHNQTVNESDALLLTCNIGGNPPANISWYHDSNKELTAGSVLFISHVNRSHAGSYRCIASNGFGNPVTSHANVLVNCKLWFYRLTFYHTGSTNEVGESKTHH